MATLQVYARGDSTTANNASLNVMSLSSQPTTLLTFSDDTDGDGIADGDLVWDIFISGASDPDTVVYVGTDPTPYEFTVIFGGTLPHSNKLSNVNGEDLRGESILIISVNGQRYFFLTDPTLNTSLTLMDAFPNGAHAIENIFVCYAAGTLIETPNGRRAVEALRPGDLVLGSGGRAATVRLAVSRSFRASELGAFPPLRPVTIPAGYFAPGVPYQNLTVSALHRILVRGPEMELLFGIEAAYVAARDLPVTVPAAIADMTYVHFLCDVHECVIANGCESESLLPGDVALAALGPAEGQAVRDMTDGREYSLAYPCLTAREAGVWRDAIRQRWARSA